VTTIEPARGYDWAFVGLTVHSLIMIRTFVIYVNDTIMAGGFVRGLLPSPTVPGPEWQDPWFYPRTHLLRKYGGLDVNGPEFRRAHRLNFQRRRVDLLAVTYDRRRRWDMMNVPHSGRLRLQWRDGKAEQIILLGAQDGAGLRDRLSAPANS